MVAGLAGDVLQLQSYRVTPHSPHRPQLSTTPPATRILTPVSPPPSLPASPSHPALTAATAPSTTQREAQSGPEERRRGGKPKFLSPRFVWLLTLGGSMTEPGEVGQINNPKSAQ